MNPLNNIPPAEIGKQLMKPTGELGLQVAQNMNISNGYLYDFVLSQLEIKNKAKILEIGVGNGAFLSKYFAINPTINMWAIDFSEIMCEQAIATNKQLIDDGTLLVLCEDSLTMSFVDKCFDVIITINTVYFWEQFEKQLLEISRVLKKGGLLVIGYRPKSVMKDLPFTQKGFRLYEPEELLLLITNNGFKLIKEDKQATDRTTVDGTAVKSTDICLMVEKI